MIRLTKAFVFLAILAVGGAGAALAVEVDFGALVPSPNGCTTIGSDSGYVCGNSQVFTTAGNTFTATGFDNPFVLDDTSFLTLKPLTGSILAPPANSLAESGLGENNSPAGTPCTSADCAIDRPFGVAVVASGNPMNDAIIGSFDDEVDSFNFFTGSSIATLIFLETIGGSGGEPCITGPVAGTCLITFPDAAAIAVQTDSGSVLITAVSATASSTIPEPSTWAMLLLGFAGVAFIGYRKSRPTGALAA